MIGAWTINVGGRVYGPYSYERMRSFAGEGRLVPQSLVAHEGSSDWHEAREQPEFSGLFGAATQRPAPAEEARPADAQQDVPAQQRAQMVILLDVKSRLGNGFEQTIFDLGPAFRVLPNAWIVSTTDSANAVRNLDALFVIDATRNKSAWFNFGPEADAKIRRVWQKSA
jgi:hypothetical protein